MQIIPEGLALQPTIISCDKEKEIISWLDSRSWSNTLSRRTQHYGFEYNYKSKNLLSGPKLEGPILEIAEIIKKAGLMDPDQCIVNEYYRNQGISPHIDSLIFGPVIIGVSISCDGVMIFERNQEKFECFLPQRSLIMLSGPARYEWKHSIDKKISYIDNYGNKITKSTDYRRISLTYRESLKK